MGKYNNFDLGGNPVGFSLPDISGGGEDEGGCFSRLAAIIIVGGLILYAIDWFIKEKIIPFIQWLEVTSPYKEIIIYYSYALLPFGILLTYIGKLIMLFPEIWKYTTKPGLTEYPNVNLILGIISVLIFGIAIIVIFNFIIQLLGKALRIRWIRQIGNIYIAILLLPIALLIVWYIFLFVKYIYVSLTTWLFKK